MQEMILIELNQIKKELQDIHSILEQRENELYKYTPPNTEQSMEDLRPSLARSVKDSKSFFTVILWIGVLVQILTMVFS